MPEPPRPHERGAALAATADRAYDLIVVGGGINGAGIARNAALRGLSVALFEDRDYGFGTTWRSTKLIHGGLRYLEHREFRLVAEGLRERAVLLRTAPHLVRPLEFLLPVFRGGRYSRHMIQAGLTLYDLLGGRGGLPRHRTLSRRRAVALEPALNQPAITGAFRYYDAQVALPERLCWETVRSAAEAGAAAFNHVTVIGLVRGQGRIHGVLVRDTESGAEHEVRGRTVINAAGPWVDALLRGLPAASDQVGGTKGVHLVVDWQGRGPRRALYAEAGADGRPFFIIPWRGRHLIGTTDTRYTGDPWDARPDAEDVAYLRQEVTRLLPGVPLRDDAILYAYAGVRPLPRASVRREGAITRRHIIRSHSGLNGLISVVGGKLTSYRSLADEVVRRVCKMLGREPGADPTRAQPLVPGLLRPVHEQGLSHLQPVYGGRAAELAAMIRLEPAFSTRLCPHGADVVAQAVYAVRHEQARSVGDVLLRRTPAGWNACRGIDAAPAVATLLGKELAWDNVRVQAEVANYRAEVDATLFPCAGALGSAMTPPSRSRP